MPPAARAALEELPAPYRAPQAPLAVAASTGWQPSGVTLQNAYNT